MKDRAIIKVKNWLEDNGCRYDTSEGRDGFGEVGTASINFLDEHGMVLCIISETEDGRLEVTRNNRKNRTVQELGAMSASKAINVLETLQIIQIFSREVV